MLLLRFTAYWFTRTYCGAIAVPPQKTPRIPASHRLLDLEGPSFLEAAERLDSVSGWEQVR